ncbi:hypothetical protein PMUG01_API003900 (apicoplast) [Plasmodium malariae]|uniref:Open reading frame 105 n=1 Tax=Plasmodium malariae TaxID=5858 RepID=H7CDG4_PLAMA|nr:hypothetical protein PMUG01_API003900 [Plasmodium malariae]BAL70584.1 open reading frame 105 [Plasmodium malariae]SBT86803.1 hypothetical protein PMUG01_API003900 [Plasmodium malariae]
MIFNLYYKLKKNLLLKKFKNIKKNNIKKFIYIKKYNILLKSKNSNCYIYNIINYKYKNLKLLYILSNKYNLILTKIINFYYIIYNNYNINYNNIHIIKNIFTYF